METSTRVTPFNLSTAHSSMSPMDINLWRLAAAARSYLKAMKACIPPESNLSSTTAEETSPPSSSSDPSPFRQDSANPPSRFYQRAELKPRTGMPLCCGRASCLDRQDQSRLGVSLSGDSFTDFRSNRPRGAPRDGGRKDRSSPLNPGSSVMKLPVAGLSAEEFPRLKSLLRADRGTTLPTSASADQTDALESDNEGDLASSKKDTLYEGHVVASRTACAAAMVSDEEAEAHFSILPSAAAEARASHSCSQSVKTMMEDLDLQILTQRLKLVSSQRRLSTLHWKNFRMVMQGASSPRTQYGSPGDKRPQGGTNGGGPGSTHVSPGAQGVFQGSAVQEGWGGAALTPSETMQHLNFLPYVCREHL